MITKFTVKFISVSETINFYRNDNRYGCKVNSSKTYFYCNL